MTEPPVVDCARMHIYWHLRGTSFDFQIVEAVDLAVGAVAPAVAGCGVVVSGPRRTITSASMHVPTTGSSGRRRATFDQDIPNREDERRTSVGNTSLEKQWAVSLLLPLANTSNYNHSLLFCSGKSSGLGCSSSDCCHNAAGKL